MEIIENTLKFFSEKDASKRITYFKTLLEVSFAILYSISLYREFFGDFDLIDPTDFKDLYIFFTSGNLFICLGIFILCFLFSRHFLHWAIKMIDFSLYYLLGFTSAEFIKDPYKFLTEHKIIKEKRREMPQKGNLFELIYNLLKSFYLRESKDVFKNLFHNMSLITQAFFIYIFYLKKAYNVPAILQVLIWITFCYMIFNQLVVYFLIKILDEKGYSLIEKMEGFMKFHDNYDSIGTSFSSDKPIFSRKHNILPHRDKYSQLIYHSIVNYSQKDGLVICINGKWGDGKSSLVNMALEPIIYNAHDKKYVLNFNPWNFSNPQGLIANFLQELKKVIRKILGFNYSEHFENKITLYINYITKGDFDTPSDKLLQDNDTEALKAELQRELRAADFKLIIVIDDIDRLDTTETGQVFKLIKSVADFPNIIYILPFDKEQVITKLETNEDYLRKFIQVEIELPPLNKIDIKTILNDKVVKLLESFEIKLNSTRWNNFVDDGISFYISNIRDINRFANGLKFHLSSDRKKELNLPDLLAITGILIFDYKLYSFIKNNRSIFHYSPGTGNIDQNEKKELADTFNSFVKERGYPERFVHHFLRSLFPELDSLVGNVSYGTSTFRVWRKEALVCSPFYFDKYFLVPTKDDKILKNEFEAIVLSSKDLAAFKRNLRRIVYDERFDFFIDRLLDYLINNSNCNRSNIIKAFLSLKGPYSGKTEYDESKMFSLHDQMLFIVLALIEEDSNFKNHKHLKDFFLNKSNQIESVDELYRRFCYTLKIDDGKYFDFEFLSSIKEVNDLGIHILYRRRLRTSFKQMVRSEKCFWLLYTWKKLDASNTYFKFVLESYINTSLDYFIDLMDKFCLKQVVHSSKYGTRERQVYRIDYLKEMMDINLIQNKILEAEKYLLEKSLKEPDNISLQVKKTVFQIRKEYFENCLSGKIDYAKTNWFEEKEK